MTCKCGCGQTLINPLLFPILDKIRERISKPIYISSGYRCPIHNDSVGGVTNSQHLYGNAADITIDDCTSNDVKMIGDIAIECGASGIGYYYSQCFVHVDVRHTVWEE